MPMNPANWLAAWMMAAALGSTAVEGWNGVTRDPAAAPAEVMTAAREAAPGVDFERATRFDRPGDIFWSVSGRNVKGQAVAVEVGTSGTVLRIIKDIELTDMDESMRAFVAKFPEDGEVVRLREIREPATGAFEFEFLGRDESGTLDVLYAFSGYSDAK